MSTSRAARRAASAEVQSPGGSPPAAAAPGGGAASPAASLGESTKEQSGAAADRADAAHSACHKANALLRVPKINTRRGGTEATGAAEHDILGEQQMSVDETSKGCIIVRRPLA